MVEELKEASDIKKLIGKNKGDEDPLLVAQRFLNIFRQLHIFDQQRRDEFNTMILALPPEIRGSFGNLPGGSLLQEYVDELEISKGIQRSNLGGQISPSKTASTTADTSGSPLSRVKSANQTSSGTTTLIGGEAKIVADASFAQVLSQSVSSALLAANASQNSNFDQILKKLQETSGNGKIVPDEKFATSMARAFSQALQFSDANKKADIQELIKAVRESRKIELPEGFAFPAQAVTPTIANEASLTKNLVDTISKVIKPGVSQASTISDSDIKELIKAVRENKGLNEQVLAKAMADGLKPLLNQLANNNAPLTQQLKISTDADLSEIIVNAITKTFEISEKKHLEQNEKFVSGLQEALNKLKSEASSSNNIKFSKNNKQNENVNSVAAALPVYQEVNSAQIEKITQDFTKTLRSLSDSRKSENREIAQAIKETQKELLKLLNNKTAQTENDNNKKANSNNIVFSAESINDIVMKIAQAQASVFQEMAKQQTNELSAIISLALKESQKSSVDTLVDTFKKFQEHNIQLNLPIYQILQSRNSDITDHTTASLDVPAHDILNENESVLDTSKNKKSFIQRAIEKSNQLQENDSEADSKPSVKKTKQNVAEYIKAEFEPAPIDGNSKVSGADWGFDEDNSKNVEFVQSMEPYEFHSDDEGEWEWEYEEDPNTSSNSEVNEWEWEYEEEPATENSSTTDEDGGEWEWEYEEEPIAENLANDDSEWEWEYEEEQTLESPETENIASNNEEADLPHNVSNTATEPKTQELYHNQFTEALSEPIENLSDKNNHQVIPTNHVTDSPDTNLSVPQEVDIEESNPSITPNDVKLEDSNEEVNSLHSEENVSIQQDILSDASNETNDISREKNDDKPNRPTILSSADLLATIKNNTPNNNIITEAEIGIAELRNINNTFDPYLNGNISV